MTLYKIYDEITWAFISTFHVCAALYADGINLGLFRRWIGLILNRRAQHDMVVYELVHNAHQATSGHNCELWGVDCVYLTYVYHIFLQP